MIMNETTAKVCEEQVAGLTIENAHRVTMIRKKVRTTPVPFHFRKEHHGTGNYVHLYGNRKIAMNCIPGTSKTGKP